MQLARGTLRGRGGDGRYGQNNGKKGLDHGNSIAHFSGECTLRPAAFQPYTYASMDKDFHVRSLDGRKEQAQAPRTVRHAVRSRRRSFDFQAFLAGTQRRIRAFLAQDRKTLIRKTLIGGAGFIVLYGSFLWFTLPDISDARNLIAAQSSVIVDHKGTELYRLFREEDRIYIPGEQIPKFAKDAIVAIEDERFYDRGCLDIRALARVIFSFGQSGGASTLTRQLARNALDLKKDFIVNRKLKEIILGCQLESHYSKDELLNLYLNWIPFGKNAYGIGLASKTYFNKESKDLTLPEAAVLAALPQAPSYYYPYGKHVRTTVTDNAMADIVSGKITKASQINDDDVVIGLMGGYVGTGATFVYVGGRTDQVLQNMKDQGSITEEQHTAAIETLKTLEFKQQREDIRAAHFVLWVKKQAEELLAGGAEEGILDQGGLTIETTLDWDMQQAAEKAIASKKDGIAKTYMANNIALVSVEVGTNKIRAYVGNSDYNDTEHGGKVDMAQAPRQPGSSFKPFVYGAAFEKGYGPATVLYDVPTKIGTDEPQNFDGKFWGLMDARHALGASRNIPAIKAFFLAGGEDGVLDFASRLGASSPVDQKQKLGGSNFEYGWPLALGAGETPLTQMVNAYATYADGGVYKPLVSIERIKDRRGNILYEAPEEKGSQVIDPGIAYQVTSVLSDTSARPNEYWQGVLNVPGYQTAAKTGTSNKCLDREDDGGCTNRRPSDLWTMGFTPNLVTGIWMGNADSAALAATAESLNLASPIWKEYMTKAHAFVDNPKTSFAMPGNIVQPQISALSGELPSECTPITSRRADVFLADRMPTLSDPACVTIEVDKVTGLLASDECPVEAREKRSFFVPTSILAERFPQWDQSVQAWAESQKGSYDPLTGAFTGSTLPLPLIPRDKCSLALTPGRLTKPSITIESPGNNGSASFPTFQPKVSVTVGDKVRTVIYELDGKSVGRATDAPYTTPIRVPKSIKEGGTHTLKVTVTDTYYNTASDEVRFTFNQDTSGPSIRISSPDDGDEVTEGEPLTITANADDDNGGIKYVEIFADDLLLSRKPSAPYSLTYSDLKEGKHLIRVVATDLSGNTREDSVEIQVKAKTEETPPA